MAMMMNWSPEEEEARRKANIALLKERGMYEEKPRVSLSSLSARAPGDVTKAFGRPATSSVEQQLGTQALNLKFDPEALRTARRNVFESDVGTSREQMARTFALSPGGLRTGAGENRFTGIETERLRGLQQIEADIAKMTPEQQRANAQTLAGILGQREQAGLAERGQTEQERAAKIRESQAAGALTGTLNGALTVEQQRLDEEERAALIREQQSLTSILGETDIGVQTEASRAAREQERLAGIDVGTRQTDMVGRLSMDQLNAKVQRAATKAGVTGTWTDPETGASLGTLQAELARRQQTETERSAQAGERLQEGALTGTIEGGRKLSDIAMKRALGLPDDASIRELDAQAAAAGYTKDASGQYTAPSERTLEAQRTTSQIDLGERAMTVQESQAKWDKWKDSSSLTGTLTLMDQNGNPVINPDTGQPVTASTLAAQELALQEGVAKGMIGTDKTVQQQALDIEEQIGLGQLALQQSAQAFGQQVTEAELTGLYKSMGPAQTGMFMQSFDKSAGDPGFNSNYDFNGDGSVGLDDFAEFTRVSEGKPVETLGGQALANETSGREFQETIQKAGVTGRLDGQKTVQELQRQYNNLVTDANTFVDIPPVSFTYGDFEAAFGTSPSGSKKGDATYRADLDFNNDDKIDFDDYAMLGTSDRMTNMGGDEDDPSSVGFMYVPEGKRTALSAQLGIQEKTLNESVRQFDDQFNDARERYMSAFSGVMVDADGVPKHVYDAETKEWRQPTSMEKEAHEGNMRIFNEKMDQTAGGLAARMGLIPEDPATVDVLLDEKLPAALKKVLDKKLLGRATDALAGRGVIRPTPAQLDEEVNTMKKALLIPFMLGEEAQLALAGTMANVVYGSQYNVQYQPDSGFGAAVAGAVGAGIGGVLGGPIGAAIGNRIGGTAAGG